MELPVLHGQNVNFYNRQWPLLYFNKSVLVPRDLINLNLLILSIRMYQF